MISDIILKCLSKQPESRYQSAFGLKKDLEKCRELIDKTGQIPYFNAANLMFLTIFTFLKKYMDVKTN